MGTVMTRVETVAFGQVGSGPATAETWEIDSAHSLVEFAVKHMMFTTVKGRFAAVDGTIRADEGDPANSAVQVTIAVASIDTRDEKRDGHLRSPDFFDAEHHPTITFRSTRVTPTGDTTANVTGDLTMHGVTREITLDAEETGRGTSPFGPQVIGFTATTTLNRKDYGLGWNAALESGGVLVGEDVRISLDVEATN